MLETLYCYMWVNTNLVLGQFYFTRLQVNADWPDAFQLFGSPRKPSVQLIQCVLKLTQTQQSALQLMLLSENEEKRISKLYI